MLYMLFSDYHQSWGKS